MLSPSSDASGDAIDETFSGRRTLQIRSNSSSEGVLQDAQRFEFTLMARIWTRRGYQMDTGGDVRLPDAVADCP